MQVNILDAKNRLSQLVKSARAGEEVVIANRGVPVARLVAANEAGSGAKKAASIVDWLAAHPLPAHLRRNHDEIASAIAEERAAWD